MRRTRLIQRTERIRRTSGIGRMKRMRRIARRAILKSDNRKKKYRTTNNGSIRNTTTKVTLH